MQATTAKVLDGGGANQVTAGSADANQHDSNGQSPPSGPKKYGSWIVERRYPLDQQSSACCGGGPRYRESVIKCLAEYELLPKKNGHQGKMTDS